MNSAQAPPAVVSISGLSRRFGETVALDDVSLSLPVGRVFGLVGRNGAGKTTLLRHILGLMQPQSGTVRVFGSDPVADPAGVLARVGYLSEDRDLPGWMRVGQLITYTRAFYPNWDDGFAGELREMFELNESVRVRALSRGQAARLGLLLALAHRPELLVLDEPSSGLDPIVRQDILSAIIRTIADEGRTVIFSSHLLDEVQRVADDIAIVSSGRIATSGPLDEVIAAHTRLSIVFAEPPPEPPVLPGALAVQGSGRQWTAIVNGEADDVVATVQRLAGEVVDRGRPTLEEVFVARASGRMAGEAQ